MLYIFLLFYRHLLNVFQTSREVQKTNSMISLKEHCRYQVSVFFSTNKIFHEELDAFQCQNH